MAIVQTAENGIPYMTSTVIRAKTVFTTRAGGVSTGIFESFSFSSNRGDNPEHVRENYRRLCAILGVPEDGAAVTLQVHGNVVRTVTEEDRHVPLTDTPYEADGIVTAVRGLPLICFTADCVPVLLCDDDNAVAGAIHCGWCNSVADILKNAVDSMCALGAERGKIRAAIGPAISRCCFECDDDVPDAVTEYLSGDVDGLFLRRDDGKTMVDLKGANFRRLVQLGLNPENIDVSDECTFCSHDKYWSHRYTHGRRGSQASAIVLPL